MSIRQSAPRKFKNLLLLAVMAWVLYGACVEVYNIAWDTGTWLGRFSLKWGLAFFLFSLFCIFSILLIGKILGQPQTFEPLLNPLLQIRKRLGIARWVLAGVLLLSPVYILQYTFWGVVLHGPSLRVVLLSFSMILLGFLFTKDGEKFIGWGGLLASAVLVSGTWTFFSSIGQITDYPFSLGWSEGNRLWDYSILFGRRLYDYPDGKEIPVYLDVGRQLIGGIPFLLPRLTIWQERLWLSLIGVVPYLVLGWVSFHQNKKDVVPWLLAGVWAFTFVKQGPIHPPLLICAILVAAAWGRPLWLAIPLVLGAGFFAVTSRFTWLFAPAMWAAMLEMISGAAHPNQLDKKTWMRAISVGVAGVIGGYVMPFFIPLLRGWLDTFNSETTILSNDVAGGVTLDFVQSSVSDQPLLWYRLFPNETFAPGILIGLLLAVGPLIIVLVYLAQSRQWALNGWQKLAILSPLLAFLLVGLIASTKIGGGGDLHNLDMFIIGLMFTAAVAWRCGGRQWIDNIGLAPAGMKIVMLALITAPLYWVVMELKPLSIHGNIHSIAVLADISPLFVETGVLPDPLPGTLPSSEDAQEALDEIRAEVEHALLNGDILFMDQRQLLTFGYITGVPLVPEYDKKVLIDKAMSEDSAYFDGFYRDLAARRFSLIITNPLHQTIKTEDTVFGEENNAWVKWVSTPLLCYYEPVLTLKKVKVQLLAPRQDISNCTSLLP